MSWQYSKGVGENADNFFFLFIIFKSFSIVFSIIIYLPTPSSLVISKIVIYCFIIIVDGGHRAIKYTRLGGVSDEVYAEGTHLVVSWTFYIQE